MKKYSKLISEISASLSNIDALDDTKKREQRLVGVAFKILAAIYKAKDQESRRDLIEELSDALGIKEDW